MRSADHSSTNLEATARPTDQQPDGITLSKGLTSQVILEILGMILAGRSLQEVLTYLARVVEAQREDEGMLCSVWLLDRDRVHMRAIAAPTLPESYIAALDGFVVGCASPKFDSPVFSTISLVFLRAKIFEVKI